MSQLEQSDYSLRGSVRPTVPLWAGARSAGHYILNTSFRQRAKTGNFVELFWGIAGSFRLDHRQRKLQVGPEQVAFLFPGEEHRYRILEGRTEFCWLTLDGPRCEELREIYKLPDGVLAAGRCPRELFMELESEIREIGRRGQYRASITAMQILHRALAGAEPEAENRMLVERFKMLAEQRFPERSCCVDSLAFELRVHRGTLHRAVSVLGCTPSEYIAGLRLRLALKLLSAGNISVNDVATACGYANGNYLAKVMRRMIAKSPRDVMLHGD